VKILIVSEGKHELGPDEGPGALGCLVRRLLGFPYSWEHKKLSSPDVRIQSGKGGLCYRRALAWIYEAARQGFHAIVIVMDQDGLPEREEEFQRAQDFSSIPLPRALGVAVRTFDAWMLPDQRALAVVLGYPARPCGDPEEIVHPKGDCEAMLVESGCGMSQSEFYAQVAGRIDLGILKRKCRRGFAPFAARVEALRR
jgi:hypothetical protein